MSFKKLRPRADEAKHRIVDTLKKFVTFKKDGNKLHRKQQQPERSEPRRQEAKESVLPIETPDIMTALRVTMNVRFESPKNWQFSKTYDASPSFNDDDKVCDGLKEHIDHCAKEIVTRQEIDALQSYSDDPPHLKTAQYHIIIRTYRRGQKCAEQHFPCFQKEPIDIEKAHDIVIEADRMLARYMQRHDPEFEWELPSIIGFDPLRHMTAPPNINGPQDICCVPTYSDEPGYSIHVSVATRDHADSEEWSKRFDSQQMSPLTLSAAELLMSNVSAIARHAVDDQENTFLARHTACNGQEGTSGCKHVQKDAFELSIRIKNNLGPDYRHLRTKWKTYRVLFPLSNPGEFHSFVEKFEMRINRHLEEADQSLQETNDLKIKIHELRGDDWDVQNPLTLTADSSALISRESCTKIIQRLPARIKHELDGHGVSAIVTAHHRGHLIFDSVIHGSPIPRDERFDFMGSLESKQRRIQRLILARVRGDMAMILKDTTSIDHTGQDPLEMLHITLPPVEMEEEPATATPERPSANSPHRLQRIPHFDDLRSSLDINRTRTGGVIGQAYGGLDEIVSEKKVSKETTPSLADTASISQPDEAVTPDNTSDRNEQWHFKALDDLNGEGHTDEDEDESYQEESTIIHHRSHLGEATATLVANVANAYVDEDLHVSHDHVASKELTDDNDSPALALLGLKGLRDQGSVSPMKLSGGPLSPPASTQQRASIPPARTIYNMPNEHIMSLSAATSVHSYLGESATTLTASNSLDEGNDPVRDISLDRPKGREGSRGPKLFSRTIKAQSASTSSSLVNVSGHITRPEAALARADSLGHYAETLTQQELQDLMVPRPSRPTQNYRRSDTDQASLYSFELGADII